VGQFDCGEFLDWKRAGLGRIVTGMTNKSEFRPKKRKTGTWTVVISTDRHEYHVGDFETEEEAACWMAANSENWPAPMDKSK
jgi:hypothetical protein